MDYRLAYENLVQKALERTDIPNVIEKHHIVPKSMGGTNAKSNIVFFTPKEHYVAHHLLWKIHNNRQMFYAYWCMVTKMGRNKDLYKVTCRAYEKAKTEHRIISSETHAGKIPWNKNKTGVYSPETIEKMSNSRIGIKESEETKLKKSISAKNRLMPENIQSEFSKNKRKISNSIWRNNNQISCPHCKKTGVKYNMERYHFDNCIMVNPEQIRESKSKGKKLKTHACPHCDMKTSMGNLRRWHFDKCKNKKEE